MESLLIPCPALQGIEGVYWRGKAILVVLEPAGEGLWPLALRVARSTPRARGRLNDRKLDPARFAPLADGDGMALIQRRRAFRREYIAPALGRFQRRSRRNGRMWAVGWGKHSCIFMTCA